MTRLPDLERAFPRLVSVEYSKSSDQDLGYNCIAWAAEDCKKIWSDDPAHYWPLGATRGWDVDALTSAFAQLGYSVCSDGGPEDGYEKVALYADVSGEWQHAVRQMADGHWTSKMGTEGEDIIHLNPADVGGTLYGEVVRYMKRPVPTTTGTSAD